MNRVDEARRRAPEALPPLPVVTSEAVSDALFPSEVHGGEVRPPTPVVVADADKSPLSFLEHDKATRYRFVVSPAVSVESREQYRLLAATLHKGQLENGLKVVMVASAVTGEGKTLTAVNLALTLSESYQRRVVIVDADLRRPAVHRVFQLDNSNGWASGLSDSQGASDLWTLPLRWMTGRLAVVTAGESVADPMAGLTSERMRCLIQLARETFDWVIVDTPPLGVLPDAGLVAALTDKAVLVVKAASTPYDLVIKAADALGRQKIAGVVLNGAAAQPHSTRYRY